MLEIYAFSTPNSVKVAIAAQELGLPTAPFPAVKRWHDEILSRPAVAAAITSTLALAR
jgi:glutathione S-transferase